MKLKTLAFVAAGILLAWEQTGAAEPSVTPPATVSESLAGTWRFALDPKDQGIPEKWFARDLDGKIRLPGVLQAQGFGDPISTTTPWVLGLCDHHWFLRADYQSHTKPGSVKVPFTAQPPRHYLGPAWYQRDIEIPPGWQDRRVVLFLERTRWETQVWLDDKPVGTNNSLITPHEFDLGIVKPGRHRLTIRVDNRMILPYRPDAHAVSDSLAGTWNGIVGAIELRSTPPVWLDDVRVYPDAAGKTVKVTGTLGNRTGMPGKGSLRLEVESPKGTTPPPQTLPVEWDVARGTFETVVQLGDAAELWDEFHPALHRLKVSLTGDATAVDSRTIPFGLRDFRIADKRFTMNGRLIHLRGTHHGGDFPLTGYPPTDPAYWRKILGTCKEWGLNHIRFHSFCPPDAAFTAADEMGIYLLIETGMWNAFDPGSPMEKHLYLETERILRAYGNHPSFVLLSPTNEPKGRWRQVLPQWAEHFRAVDPRRFYSSATGFTDRDAPGPVDKIDFTTLGRIGSRDVRGKPGWFGRDHSATIAKVPIPVIGHEIGQWCAYPDFDVIRKFTGYMRPGNYEIFRDSSAAHGLLEKNHEFAMASGRFQVACYKEDIEANLRTANYAGLQLLDLHDYVGQGTALVAPLDPFWEEKGYVTADEWRRFCSTTVPLARLARRTFTANETIEAPVEIAHYGAAPLQGAAFSWEITGSDGHVLGSGKWQPSTLPVGLTRLDGPVRFDLSGIRTPQACKLTVRVNDRIRNDWNFWVYPAPADPTPEPSDVLVTRSWNEAEAKLAAGGRVLFLPRSADIGWSSPTLDDVPIIWNRQMGPGWSRMLGLWCDAKHPALAGFPTADHCDWQWTEIIRDARTVNLDSLPHSFQPIVQAIDDWNRNWKLGVIFEAEVGAGRLLVCSLDLTRDLEKRPVARQLRQSLLAYAAGDHFKPAATLSPEQVRGLWFDTLVMRKLGALSTSKGADAAFDGDPNTFWIAGGGKGASYPHVLDISFPDPVRMKGFVVMNRQNDRNHIGDIRRYLLEASDDGTAWREISRGELASTWSPQTVMLPKEITARHLRLTALSSYIEDLTIPALSSALPWLTAYHNYGKDTAAAIAEFAVLPAGPPLPETSEAGEVEYKKTRSTTTEIY